MPPQAQPSTVSFLGVLVQLGGAALLVGFFMLLRRYVFRRAYFSAWVSAWTAITVAIFALVVRYMVVIPFDPSASDDSLGVRLLYFVYQAAKLLAFVYFLRGTAMYVAGGRAVGPF